MKWISKTELEILELSFDEGKEILMNILNVDIVPTQYNHISNKRQVSEEGNMREKKLLNSFVVFLILQILVSLFIGTLLNGGEAIFIFLGIVTSSSLISATIYSSTKK